MKSSKWTNAWDRVTPSQADKERMLQNIRLSIATAQKGKGRRSPLRVRSWAAALTALVLLIGTALAAVQLMQTIGWDGKPLCDLGITFPSTPPPEHPEENPRRDSWFERAHLLGLQNPGTELWMLYERQAGEDASEQSFWHSNPMQEKCKTREEFDRLIAPAGHMKLPSYIPEQYHFFNGQIIYFPPPDANAVLVAQEQREDDLLLKRYGFDKGHEACVESYLLNFYTEDGKNLTVSGTIMRSDHSAGGFGVQEGDEYRTVDIPGIDKALLFKRDGAFYLRKSPYMYDIEMMSVLSPSVKGQDAVSVLSGETEGPYVPIEFDKAYYSIVAEGITEEETMKIANSFQ